MAKISGYWKFNDVPTVQVLSEAVTFYSYNGSNSAYQEFYGFIASGTTYLNYYTAEGLSAQTWTFKTSTGEWRADQCKIVDFGTDTQTVSDTFYAWFTANATEIERPTLEGVWVLNETLSTGISSNIVPFVSNGKLFAKMVTSLAINGWVCLNYFTHNDTSVTTADNAYYFQEWDGNSTGWTNNAYRTIEFVPTEQVVTLEFYVWLTENAVYQGSNDDTDTKPVYLYTGGAWVKQNAFEQQNGKWVRVSTGAISYLYNGVKLPKIPEHLLTDYPYCFIRKDTSSGYYDLIFGTDVFYLNSSNNIASDTTTKLWYRIEIATAETATEWGYYKGTNATFGIDTDRAVLWSNLDILNGSADATAVYFEGTEIVDLSVVKIISFTINSSVYQAVNGMTWAKWVESDYNVDGYYLDSGKVVASDGYNVVSGAIQTDYIIGNSVYATKG